MQNCDFCEGIPFDTLPSEGEDALPHQPSLDALEESSISCSLCKLIWWAAGCSLASPGGMVSFRPNVEYPSGRKIMTRVTESNYSSMAGISALENGASVFDISSAKPDLREPKCLDLRSRFPQGSNVRPWLFGNWYRSPFRDRSPWLVGLGVRLGTGPSIEDAEGNSEEEVNISGTYLRIRTDDDSDMAKFVPGRLRTDFQGSEIAFQRIIKWADDCDKGHDCDKHHSCPHNRDSPALPTRLLDVNGPEDIIRVVEMDERRDHYLALSHCWGLSHRITTTVENYGQHRDGIPLSQLPATFQQAVVIARKMEIPYLWIDSLCIIQNDILDWETEASKMGSIYAHAYLTVSALSSADDLSGCFTGGNPDTTNSKVVSLQSPYISCDSLSTGRRAIALAAPLVGYYTGDTVGCRYYVPFGMRGGRKSRVYVTSEWMPPSLKDDPKTYLVGRFGRIVDPLEHEPLNKRCWTLQERLLSPRILHYGTQEMYWECQNCLLAEDGAMMTREFPSVSKMLESTSHWPDPWLRLVEEYTARKLTRDQDKLPALSGLASLIASKTGDSYIAGLWRSEVVHCLYWSIEMIELTHSCDDPEHDAAMPPPTKSSVRFPAQYRAPSWSWVALDGKVQYESLNAPNIQTRCIEVQVELAGTDRFGRVQSGWIKLEGPLSLLHSAISDERHQRIYPFRLHVEVRSGAEKGRSGDANFDDEPYFPSFALLLDDEHALILKAKGERTFTRIGTAHLFRIDNEQVSDEAASGVAKDLNSPKESNIIIYSAEETEAADIAYGSQQAITIY